MKIARGAHRSHHLNGVKIARGAGHRSHHLNGVKIAPGVPTGVTI